MCTLRMLEVVKERPQSANGHVNGLSPGKKKQIKGRSKTKKSLFEIKKYAQPHYILLKDARSYSGHGVWD